MPGTPASGSFTAVGAGPPATSVTLGEVTWSVTGTFVGTVVIEQAVAGNTNAWVPLPNQGPITAATAGTFPSAPSGAYRFRCSAYTSGTIAFSIIPPLTVDRIGQSVIATIGDILRPAGDRASDLINVLDFGAVPDGVTDNMKPVQRAINAALNAGIRKIYFPHGVYNFPDTTSAQLDPGAGNLEFAGDGKYSTILKFTGGTTVNNKKGLFYNISGSATALKGFLSFRDLAIQGSLLDATPQQNVGNVGIYCDFYSGIYFHGVRFYAMNLMAVDCHFIPQVIATGCEFDTCSRDMLRVINAFNATVTGNTFRHCGDDAIAFHTATGSSGPGLVREGITITGNVFEDTGRLAVLGARLANIGCNVIRRSRGGVTVSVDTAEGANQIYAIRISDNIITDPNVTSGTNPYQSIIVLPWTPRAGTTPIDTAGAIPGDPATTTGAVVPAVNYWVTNQNTATDAMAHSFGVHITGNILCRTMPAADGTVAGYNTYSDYGYGQAMTSTGFVNPAMTTAMLTQAVGIQADVSILGLRIKDNYISDVATGIFIGNAPPGKSGFWIEGNYLYNISAAGILGTNGTTAYLMGTIRGNFFNLDPEFTNPLRGANGTWTGSTSCIGISAANSYGLTISDNTFMNCSVAHNLTGNQNNAFFNNKVKAQYVNGNGAFSTFNRGVGRIPASGAGWIFEYIDASPGSATYGGMLNANAPDDNGTGIPTSGAWMRGHLVRSQDPNTTNVFGWLRLTSGSANVIGTDWLPVPLSGALRSATTAYTLVAADNGRTIVLNSASSVSITVPSGLGVTFQVGVVQTGAGKVTFTTSGTTINTKTAFVSGTTGVSAQYGEAKLRAYLADTFVLTGDIA